jgi:hypothetical protein
MHSPMNVKKISTNLFPRPSGQNGQLFGGKKCTHVDNET